MLKYLLILFPIVAFSQEVKVDTFKIDFQSFYVERVAENNRSFFLDNKGSNDLRCNEILHSGKVIFAGELVEMLNESLDAFRECKGYTIVSVQSNIAATFSNSNKTIFVTSGLIAQVLNREQLDFFVAREIARIENDMFPMSKDKETVAVSYADKIRFVSESSLESEIKLDKLAIDVLNRYGLETKNVKSCMNVLRYAHMPFEDVKLPNNYLNTSQYYVPPSAFLTPSNFSKANESKKITAKVIQLDERSKEIESIVGVSSSSPLKTRTNSFQKAKKEAHFLFAKQAIIEQNFRLGIYSVFLLEHLYGNDSKYDKLKAHTWFGHALIKMRFLINKESNMGFSLANESGKTFFFLRRMSAECAVSIALRISYDLKDKLPELNDLNEALLKHIRQCEFIDLKNFQGISYVEKFRNQNESAPIENNKYTKRDSLNKFDRNDLDSSKYFLFGLSDLVNSPEFWKEYNANDSKLKISDKKIGIIPSVSIFSGRSVNSNKSVSKELSLIEEIKKAGSCEVLENPISLTYKVQSELKQLFSQSFNVNNYKMNYPVLDKDALKSISPEHDYLAITLFQSAFKPKIKGYHFLGLLGVPLPFVIPDLLIRSYQSISCMCLIDAKTGSLINIQYEFFNEPLTGKIMYNRLYQFLNHENYEL